MKTIIITLMLFTASVFANIPFNTDATPDILTYAAPQEYTFSAGDTTCTFSFNNAKMLRVIIRDSSMSGTDSVGIWYKHVYNGINFYSSFQVSYTHLTMPTPNTS